MKLDRSKSPEIQAINSIEFPSYEKRELDNGIPLYVINGEDDQIVKLELVFKAGRIYESHRLISKACNQLIKDGTSNYSSEEIAEQIDFYGSTISCSTDMDRSYIKLYCLKKHFDHTLGILIEILEEATFPQEEVKKYGIRNRQRLKQELSKNNILAYRKISAEIFGTNHPYGYNTEPEEYLDIDSNLVKQHYLDRYTHKNCNIYLAGANTIEVIELINARLGRFNRKSEIDHNYTEAIQSKPRRIEIPGHKLQNSIKIGKKLFNRQHPDYYPMVMLNTILGGYFGSRLMSEIREKKGYTYSIYSIMDPLIMDGSFYVSTEVGKEHYDNTLIAIETEFDKLKHELIPENELKMARNYLMGSFLSMLDGPLKSSKVLSTLMENELDDSHFKKMIHVVKTISSTQLRDLAIKYLDYNSMLVISVGDFDNN